VILKKVNLVEPEMFLSDSVAIVGSSSKIMSLNKGELIDTYEHVIRFNRSTTKDFEKFVGSKTTIRAVNNHVFDNKDISNQGYTNSPSNFVKKLRKENILFIGPDDGPWKRRRRNTHRSCNLFKFDYQQLDKIKDIMGINTEKKLQIGTITIGLCILSNIKPHIFGFDLHNIARTHYFESRPGSIDTINHDPDNETEALRSLLSKKMINCD